MIPTRKFAFDDVLPRLSEGTSTYLDYNSFLDNDDWSVNETLLSISGMESLTPGVTLVEIGWPVPYLLVVPIGYVGEVRLRYTVSTPDGISDTAEVVGYSETARPVASYTVAEDGWVSLGIAYDGGMGFTPYVMADHGTIGVERFEEGGEEWWVYRPAPDFHGTDRVYRRDFDKQTMHYPSYSVTAIDVLAVNDAPRAANDAFRADAGTPLTLRAADLLANDREADGEALTLVSVGGAVNGAVSLVDGVVTFTPNAGALGRASFTYAAADASGLTDEATVSVDIAPPPGTGTAEADSLDFARAALPVSLQGLAGNDTLRGGFGDDLLAGGEGNDLLNGGRGADVITGGRGGDRMAGGSGVDTFVIAAGDAAANGPLDHIVDFEGAGAAGGDRLLFTGFGSGASLARIGSSDLYQLLADDGALLGRLRITTGGAELSQGDYVLA